MHVYIVNLRAGLLHNQQSVIKWNPSSTGYHNEQPFIIHSCRPTHLHAWNCPLHNYAGWTFTPQTFSSHCLLKHRPYSTSQCPPEQPWPCTSSPTGLTSSPQKLGLFPAGERETLSSTAALKKWQLELNKIEGAWKANWLMSHMQGSWRPGTAADNILPSMSNGKALQGLRM